MLIYYSSFFAILVGMELDFESCYLYIIPLLGIYF